MQYQTTLSLLMEEKQVSIKSIVNKTSFSERWLDQVLKSPNWNPCLDTVLDISEALKISAIQFVEFTETRKFNKKTYPSGIITPTGISSALKTIRLKKGLSQSDLSKLTHFQLSSISLRESMRYRNFPTLYTLEVYCKAYNLNFVIFVHRQFRCHRFSINPCLSCRLRSSLSTSFGMSSLRSFSFITPNI